MTILLSLQPLKGSGSPVNPDGQEQVGLWLTTVQMALGPQLPGQGSTHFMLTQAKAGLHSELTRHSGRQFGGELTCPGRQEQTQTPFTSRFWL